MKYFIKQLSILLLITILNNLVECIKPKGASETDLIRAQYLKLQDDIWALVNKEDIPKHDVQESLYSTYRDLTISNWTTRYNEDQFKFLRRYYEWNVVEKDIMGIQSLWDAFRTFLANQFATEGFNELAGVDFADTVFHDQQLTMNNSLGSLHLTMVKQGFYYKVALVSC